MIISGMRDEESTARAAPVAAPAETVVRPQHPSARLICLVGDAAGRVFPLGVQPTVIGRGPDADIQIEGSEISRHHARVSWVKDHFVVEDLQSRNGTEVNGVPVEQQALQIGDRIQLGGGATLVFAHHDDLERRVQRLQKLEGLAQLAAGMVHDFKNTLMVILANAEVVAQWMEERHPEEADMRAALGDILEAGEAANQLSKRLLYFARRDAPAEAVELELAALVAEVLGMVRRSFEERHAIGIEVSVDPRLRIRGNHAELHHALLNLVLNSRDAMPRGGRLTVEASLLHIVRADALRLHLPAAGPFVELSITDTGVGMDEATQARAFEPFFTTKAPGDGTGLGLATVYGVVKSHGGNVLVDSAVGRGTRFRLLLPAVIPPRSPRPSPPADPSETSDGAGP